MQTLYWVSKMGRELMKESDGCVMQCHLTEGRRITRRSIRDQLIELEGGIASLESVFVFLLVVADTVSPSVPSASIDRLGLVFRTGRVEWSCAVLLFSTARLIEWFLCLATLSVGQNGFSWTSTSRRCRYSVTDCLFKCITYVKV